VAFSVALLINALEESTTLPEIDPFVTWDSTDIGINANTSKTKNRSIIRLIFKRVSLGYMQIHES
jgi:hypothetical protein